jgi:hypothetical protein
MFVGIVAVAAGIKKAVGHADGHLGGPEAVVLAGGLALFLAGDAGFRLILRLPSVPYRGIGAVVMLGVIPAAMVAGVLGLAAAVAVLVVMLFLEDRARGLDWNDRSAWTTPTKP